MAEMRYIEALNQAFREEMRRDDKVVIWGEDVVSMNDVHGQTRDIYDEFGADRIKDTPICEQAIAGMSMGAAYRGLRPIGIFMNAAFSLCAFDGIFLKMGCKSVGRYVPGDIPATIYGVVAGSGTITRYWSGTMPGTSTRATRMAKLSVVPMYRKYRRRNT